MRVLSPPPPHFCFSKRFHYVALTVLELIFRPTSSSRDPPASAFQWLGLKACATKFALRRLLIPLAPPRVPGLCSASKGENIPNLLQVSDLTILVSSFAGFGPNQNLRITLDSFSSPVISKQVTTSRISPGFGGVFSFYYYFLLKLSLSCSPHSMPLSQLID